MLFCIKCRGQLYSATESQRESFCYLCGTRYYVRYAPKPQVQRHVNGHRPVTWTRLRYGGDEEAMRDVTVVLRPKAARATNVSHAALVFTPLCPFDGSDMWYFPSKAAELCQRWAFRCEDRHIIYIDEPQRPSRRRRKEVETLWW